MKGKKIGYSLLNREPGEEGFLWQYDYGQRMKLEAEELPEIYEVHFANNQSGRSVASLGDENGVMIPDEMLLSGAPVFFWIFLHNNAEEGHTTAWNRIEIHERAKKPERDATPEQQSFIEQVLAALEDKIVEIPEEIQAALQEAKDSGEFDGPQGERGPRGYTGADGAPGAPGTPGHSPVLTASKNGKVTTIYSDGTQLAQISDGQDGQGADVIDDTAPAANKTYSSVKVESELTTVKNEINGKQDAPLQTGSNGNFLCLVLVDNNLVPIWTDIPKATSNNLGLVKVNTAYGIGVNSSGLIGIVGATNADIKDATAFSLPIVAARNHEASFYGLAKAAGDTTQSASSNAVGVYTDDAKLKIQQMFGLWTPKKYIKYTLNEEAQTINSDNFPFDDTELNIYEEFVICIYQSDTTQTAYASNDWGYFTIRDTINTAYINVGSMYLKGTKQASIMRIKRLPSVIIVELINDANSTFVRAFPRQLDYVDKIRWISASVSNGTFKAGTTVEAYISRFY